MQDVESQVAEKEAKLKEISIELEITQKSLKLLNLGTSKLDHILILGRASKDQKDLDLKVRYQDQKMCLLKVLYLLLL